MSSRAILLLILLGFLSLTSQASSDAGRSSAPTPFYQLVGKSDWQVSLKSFSVSTQVDGNFFTLSAGDSNYFSFTAKPVKGEGTERFGPLLPRHTPALLKLIDFTRNFGNLKFEDFSINVDWELYPESVKNWAAEWQDSELRERWKEMGSREGYPLLVSMITEQLKKDFQPLALALGTEISGASMEKMAFQEVDRLKFFEETLKPAGIPADLELPMPLILSIRMKSMGKRMVAQEENTMPIMVDSLFATAKKGTTSLYASFLRGLGEYEISGDQLNPDGAYSRIRPLSQQQYRSTAAQLLKTFLRVTGENKNSSFALRLDLGLYPKVHEEVVRQFTYSPGSAQSSPVPRTQLPKLQFYAFRPSPASRFATAVNPFLKFIGYEFRHLLVSVESGRKAVNYPAYSKIFSPLGIGPEDHPKVPDIVYLIAEKRQKR